MEVKVNSIFYTLQGEGYHAGTPSIFIRLSDCNLRCSFCDTEFLSGDMMSVDYIIHECQRFEGGHIVITGGEPGTHDIFDLVHALKEACYYVQVETNGMFQLPPGIDWITCSPKTKPSTLNVEFYHELKLVIGINDKIPKLGDQKDRYNFPLKTGELSLCWVSPENPINHSEKIGTKASDIVDSTVLDHCIGLIKAHPSWRLSTQQHKYWGIE